MAGIRCQACSGEGIFDSRGGHKCPRCGAREVHVAIGGGRLRDVDPLVRALERLVGKDSDGGSS